MSQNVSYTVLKGWGWTSEGSKGTYINDLLMEQPDHNLPSLCDLPVKVGDDSGRGEERMTGTLANVLQAPNFHWMQRNWNLWLQMDLGPNVVLKSHVGVSYRLNTLEQWFSAWLLMESSGKGKQAHATAPLQTN